jgi:hypothetical protein
VNTDAAGAASALLGAQDAQYLRARAQARLRRGEDGSAGWGCPARKQVISARLEFISPDVVAVPVTTGSGTFSAVDLYINQ